MEVAKFTNKPFDGDSKYKIMLLIKDSGFKVDKIKQYYMPHIIKQGFKADEVLAVSLTFDGVKRIIASEGKEYVENNVYPIADRTEVKVLLVADAQYFKLITGKTMGEADQNYVYCSHPEFSHLRVIPIISFMSFFANPLAKQKVYLNFEALSYAYDNVPLQETKGKIKNLSNPVTTKQITKALKKLNKHKKLTIDIEAFSLFFPEAGIATISFSQSIEHSTAFYVDYMPKAIWKKHYAHMPILAEYPEVGAVRIYNIKVKRILLDFFLTNRSRYIYHNANYDAKIIIYNVFMKSDISSIKGLISGLEHMTDKSEDTYILTYLALNTCTRMPLDLKSNTVEHMGNYGIEVKDITIHTPEKILFYNAQDTVATFYLYIKYVNIPKQQDQMYLYWQVYLAMQVTTIQMELMGMGMDLNKVNKLYYSMTLIIQKQKELIMGLPIVGYFVYTEYVRNWMLKLQSTVSLTPSTKTIRGLTKFNLNSPVQLSRFLFDFLKLPVLDKTQKGKPSIKNKTIDKLLKILE